MDVALSVATRLITHRVAPKARRSQVESGMNPAESATELFTDLLWKRSGRGKGSFAPCDSGRARRNRRAADQLRFCTGEEARRILAELRQRSRPTYWT
jgi:hypothetical protein